jgi:hypothetical protein
MLGRISVVLGKADRNPQDLATGLCATGILPQAALGVQQASTLQSPEAS